jgi:Skp family chaperone for outer membrane proteins
MLFMKRLSTLAIVGAFAAAAVAFGQAKPPATQTGQKPAPRPAAPAPEPPQPPRPFPAGSKFAFINIQRIASESTEGKASTAKVDALRQKKLAELNDRNKQLEAAQQKMNQAGDADKPALQKEVERLQVEVQRSQQDAQREMQQLQQQLQGDFQRKLAPVIQQVTTEKGLQILFSQADAGIVWAEPGLDLTEEVVKRFDQAMATSKPPAAPKQPQ